MKGKGWLLKRIKIKRKKLDDLEKATLKHFGETYFNMEERIRDELKAVTESELSRLKVAVDKVSKKDWYALYRVKKSLTEILDEVLKKKGIK